jgi:hypothetical protein
MDGGFAPTFKEAVGRWRRRHRHPPANETWFAVHYRAGWLVERLSTLESIHLMRQGLDVRSLSAERPARKRKEADGATDLEGEPAALDSEPENLEPDALEPGTLQAEAVTPSTDAG